jgi:signal transduction histidine kinase
MIDSLLLEKELAANYARLEGQETERERIAKELHDHIGGMLSVVKMNFHSLNKKIEDIQQEQRDQFQKTLQMLDTACEDVRNISHELESGILEKLGLKSQLESYVDSLSDQNMEIELSTHGLKNRLPGNLEKQVFRIVQELVSNVLKHANASYLSIQVNRFDNLLNVMVEDNGIGFDPEKALKKGRMGMKNLRSRVNEVGGAYSIDSEPGRGATITVELTVADAIKEKNQEP